MEDAISSPNVPISESSKSNVSPGFFHNIKFHIMCIFCTISVVFTQLQDDFIVIL